VPVPLGHEHLAIEAFCIDHGRRVFSATTGEIASPAGTGDRIDDDSDFLTS
jgi:hypothetical protein